jgi:arogenate dehydrogenase (NADP+)
VLVSAALLQTADRQSSPSPQLAALVRSLASSGFADTTRVGGGNPALGSLMARCNRSAVQAALAAYRAQLQELEALLEQGAWPALEAELEHCRQLRPEFL